MNVRGASESDESLLHELWDEFEAEVPTPPGFAARTWGEEWNAIRKALDAGSVPLAFDGENAVGMAWATAPERGRAQLEIVYVRPSARRRGFAKALVRRCLDELAAKGATSVSLEVLESNRVARGIWRAFGFEDLVHVMAASLDELAAKLAPAGEKSSRAVIHVQSDDRTSVERAVAHFVPRLPSPSIGAEVNGWIRVSDPVLDSDGNAQGRFAAELSDRLGAVSLALALEQGAVVRFRLYERGRMVDEYLSVPTFYGELPRADELALAANPTLVARLTGASFEEVRRVARTAASTAELPPAEELYEQIARLVGVEP